MSESVGSVKATNNKREEEIGFADGLSVDVRELDERFWGVLRQFVYQAERQEYRVAKGEKTDFASVPRIFVWFIPAYGRYTKAAILHDYLCRLAREGTFERRDADGVFRQAMRTLKVPFLRRWIMWAAVRWGALFTPHGANGWQRDAIKVLLISVPMVALLLPAALVILVTLLVWYLIEMILYVPLSLAAQWKQKRQRPAKRVNRPRLSFRM